MEDAESSTDGMEAADAAAAISGCRRKGFLFLDAT
jgi:hypothetical protein